jgi:hypothetical protein
MFGFLISVLAGDQMSSVNRAGVCGPIERNLDDIILRSTVVICWHTAQAQANQRLIRINSVLNAVCSLYTYVNSKSDVIVVSNCARAVPKLALPTYVNSNISDSGSNAPLQARCLHGWPPCRDRPSFARQEPLIDSRLRFAVAMSPIRSRTSASAPHRHMSRRPR